MTSEIIAVIDIGKTNARIAFIDARSGAELWSAKRVNRIVATRFVQELDVVDIERWLIQTLQHAPHRERVSAIVPIAHGAAAVLLDEHGEIVAAPDYEDPRFETISDAYERERDPFEKTFSPSLPLGLNLARQLFFLAQQHPHVFAKVAHILLHPQYWAWRFSGVMAREVTSLGCHTDLWRPGEMAFSGLARAHDWTRLFPPARFAGDTLGVVTAAMAERTGLPRDCRVVCGIHDSNASWLQHLIDRPGEAPFAVISSGTWTVVMASATDPGRLRADRDMLANVDAFGATVGTARFMGGREYEAIAASLTAPDESGLASVLERQVMAVPSFASGGPFAAHQGKLLYADRLSDRERAALATLYTVLMTELLLEFLGAQGDTIVDGPLAENPLFGPLLAALRPAFRILPASPGANGARAVCRLASVEPPQIKAPTAVQPLRAAGLGAYRAAWRDLLPWR